MRPFARRRDAALALPAAAARATTREHAKTFALACRLLPRSVRDDVYFLYAAFRSLDDLVDDGDPAAGERVDAVARWARGGPADSPEARIFAAVGRRHPMPRGALLDFCAGMRDDLGRAPIESEEDLDRYCYRVAGTVGVVMASVLGTRREGADRHAAALGMALQRTNILRDIDEDLAAGRVYLPREALRRHSPAPGRRENLLGEQIARADALYEEGIQGIPSLTRGRRAVAASAAMYREILRQIERDGYGRMPGRAVVGRRRKLALVVRHGLLPDASAGPGRARG